MTLIISAIFAIAPLFGIAWTATHGELTTVGGLFLTLILLALSGIMFLNLVIELRSRKKKAHS